MLCLLNCKFHWAVFSFSIVAGVDGNVSNREDEEEGTREMFSSFLINVVVFWNVCIKSNQKWITFYLQFSRIVIACSELKMELCEFLFKNLNFPRRTWCCVSSRFGYHLAHREG